MLYCLIATIPLQADTWYEHYLRAEAALENERWQAAVKELNQAIELRGDSNVRVRIYGMKVTSYFPYFRLGVAYFHLGKLDAALQAFETEESLGEIGISRDDLSELESYRAMALAAKRDQDEMDRERILDVVQESIESAEALEKDQSLEEAIEALSTGLAVAPDHLRVLETLRRLQDKVAAQHREMERANRAARLSRDARELLDAGHLEQAASVLKQALSLESDPETEGLLRQTETSLRARLEREQALSDRQQEIENSLGRALQLASAGRRKDALAQLQRVLVLEPDSIRAHDLQSRLIREEAEGEARLSAEAWIGQRLLQARDALAASELTRALALANQVLAVSTGHADAHEIVRTTFLRINRELLGSGRAENLPPAISFIDLRLEQEDGTLVDIVTERDYVLSGLVFDESPIAIVSYRGHDEEIAVTTHHERRGQQHLTHFRLSLRLAEGPNQLRLVASDPGQLSSSSSYEVRYEPPFFRTSTFYFVLLTLFASSGSAVYLQRASRRRQLQKRRFNPYVAGAPVFDESLFFGRKELLDRVLEAIASNSILLFGERRIGKTSIQHQLRRRLQNIEDEEYEFYPVFIDLQGIGQEKFFATIADEIFNELGVQLWEFADRQPLADEDYDYHNLVRDLRDVLRALRKRSSKRIRLVLQIDEIDQLNSYEPRVNQLLRSLFMKSFAENLVAVVSGVRIKKHWELEGSPWYNFFEEIEVLPLLREPARRLVENPIKGILEIESGLVDRMYDLSEGKPYALQKICKALVNRAYEAGTSRITLADLEAIDPPSVS